MKKILLVVLILLATSLFARSQTSILVRDDNGKYHILKGDENGLYAVISSGISISDTASFTIKSIKSFSEAIFLEDSSFSDTTYTEFNFSDTVQKITITTDTDIVWNTTGSGAGSQVFSNTVDIESIETTKIYIKLKNDGVGYITVRGVKE